MDMVCLFNGHGFLIGDSAQLPFSRKKTAYDIAFYARKRGDQLLRDFLKWAMHRRCVDVTLGSTNPDPRLDRLYIRLGFRKLGGVFQRSI